MTMDTNLTINDLRTLITTLSFLAFAGIVYWAWSSRQKARFDEAANLPFVDDDLDPVVAKQNHNSGERK